MSSSAYRSPAGEYDGIEYAALPVWRQLYPAGSAPSLAPTLANSCPSAIVAAPVVVDAGGRQIRRTIAGDAANVQLPEDDYDLSVS
jgi:hypothetical protein